MQLQSDSCLMEPMAMIYTYIHKATVGNTIQTVTSPMYDTYMTQSTPSNTAKLGATHSNIQTAQRGPSLVGSEPTKPRWLIQYLLETGMIDNILWYTF